MQMFKKCLNSRYKNLEKQFITSRNYEVTNYQTLEEVPWLLRLEEPKKQRSFSKKTLKCKFYQKIANIFNVKILKNIPLLPGSRKTWILTNVKKFLKNAKIRDVQMSKAIPLPIETV